MMLTKHFTDSYRKAISWAGDKDVVEPEGGPKAVFRRPLTILQASDGIIRVLIHFTKPHTTANRLARICARVCVSVCV